MAVSTKRHYLALKYARLLQSCSDKFLLGFCCNSGMRLTSSEAHLSSFGIELALRYAGSRMPSRLCCFARRLGAWSRSQIVSYWWWNFDGRKLSGRAFIEEQCWFAETRCCDYWSIGNQGSTSVLPSSSPFLHPVRLTGRQARR